MESMQFSDLGLSTPILRAIADAGYGTPTPIQQKAIPHVLSGRDLLGCAQTGTGKTAAFALPILDNLARATAASPSAMPGARSRVLVLSPTRELASQIGESFVDLRPPLRADLLGDLRRREPEPQVRRAARAASTCWWPRLGVCST